MIISAEKIQRRIEQTGLLQSQINRIGALISSQSASAQTFVGLPRIFILIRQASFKSSLSAALKDTQNVSRLRNFPTGKRIEELEKSSGSLLFL